MFELTPLPFAADALAPNMSQDTLNTHHGKHHQAYVTNTNNLVKEKGLEGKTIEELVAYAKEKGEKGLFNNAAQTWNHGFFWESLTPTPAKPSGDLAAAIEKSFGSYDAFRTQFLDQGKSHFASGWIWLVTDKAGALKLVTTPNAEQPDGAPILVCDLWEHAYYIDYKNERPRFLTAFIDAMANWDFAAKNLEAAKAGRVGYAYAPPK